MPSEPAVILFSLLFELSGGVVSSGGEILNSRVILKNIFRFYLFFLEREEKEEEREVEKH